MKTNEFYKGIDPTLTEDDIKVIKHLKAIDNLFKRGNLSVYEIFANTGGIVLLKNYNGEDYVVAECGYINADGGDPDMMGPFGIHPYSEWLDLMEERNNG